MKTVDVPINGKKAIGMIIPLPHAPLVVVYGGRGFLMCGYLNIEAAEKMGVAAAMVRGVSSIGELLKASVVSATTQAGEKGVTPGMSGKDALSLIL